MIRPRFSVCLSFIHRSCFALNSAKIRKFFAFHLEKKCNEKAYPIVDWFKFRHVSNISDVDWFKFRHWQMSDTMSGFKAIIFLSTEWQYQIGWMYWHEFWIQIFRICIFFLFAVWNYVSMEYCKVEEKNMNTWRVYLTALIRIWKR